MSSPVCLRFQSELLKDTDRTGHVLLISALLAGGRPSIADAEHLLGPSELELRDQLRQLQLQSPELDFSSCYESLCDLFSSWETADRDPSCLNNDDRALLIRIGFAQENLASFTLTASFAISELESTMDGVTPHDYHSIIAGTKPWRTIVYGDDGPGRGYAVFPVLPRTLAEIYGHVSTRCGSEVRYRKITQDGGFGRQMIKFIENRNVKREFKRNQRIIENMHQSVDLSLLAIDFAFWIHYEYAPHQVGFAILGSGFNSSVDAGRQVIHTDMASLQGGNKHPYGTDRPDISAVGKQFPLANILSLSGGTYLIIEPESWGCEFRTTPEPYFNPPGIFFMMHGNFNHCGDAHTVASWRCHWYRPLRVALFDSQYLDLC